MEHIFKCWSRFSETHTHRQAPNSIFSHLKKSEHPAMPTHLSGVQLLKIKPLIQVSKCGCRGGGFQRQKLQLGIYLPMNVSQWELGLKQPFVPLKLPHDQSLTLSSPFKIFIVMNIYLYTFSYRWTDELQLLQLKNGLSSNKDAIFVR